MRTARLLPVGRLQDLRGSHWAAFGLLLLLCLAAYGNSLGNGFVRFDDSYLIESNAQIKEAPSLLGLLAEKRKKNPGYKTSRRLRLLTYALDYRLSGEDPFAFHLSNVLYHVLTAFFVFLIGKRLLRSHAAGLAAAAIFALHPVQTESVAYLAGRRDLLVGLFYAAGFHFFLAHRETGGSIALAGLPAAFAAGLMSKETIVTLPLACALYELLSGKPRRRLLAALAAAAGLALAVPVLKLDFSLAGLGRHGLGDWLGGAPSAHAATAARIAVHALKLLLWPATLLADYSYDAFPASASAFDARALAGAALLAAGLWGAMRLRSIRPAMAFSVLWIVVSYLPTSQIIPYREVFAEHWLYVPSMGFAFLAAAVLQELAARGPYARKAAAAALCAGLAACGARTAARNMDWRDSRVFWSKTAETAPRCARARHNLGLAYQDEFLRSGSPEAFQRARSHYQAALALRPKASTWSNLGALLRQAGAYGQAAAAQEQALELEPKNPAAHYNLGLLHHFHGGDPGRAAWHYEQALRAKPRLSEARNNLGLLRLESGDLLSAKASFLAALEADPRNPAAHNNLGLVLIREKDWTEAVRRFYEAARLGGHPAKLRANLARLYEARGLREAVAPASPAFRKKS